VLDMTLMITELFSCCYSNLCLVAIQELFTMMQPVDSGFFFHADGAISLEMAWVV
jgi:hypothetical protein